MGRSKRLTDLTDLTDGVPLEQVNTSYKQEGLASRGCQPFFMSQKVALNQPHPLGASFRQQHGVSKRYNL
jgi:hypothetical protein